MATLEELKANGDIDDIDGNLSPSEMPQRYLYIVPEAADRVRKILSEQVAKWSAKLSLEQQLEMLFHDFCSGAQMHYHLGVPGFNALNYGKEGVWELKMADWRLFGWFPEKDTFLISGAVDAATVKDGKLYDDYITQTVKRRRALDLDDPKYISGSNPDHVVSNFTYPA